MRGFASARRTVSARHNHAHIDSLQMCLMREPALSICLQVELCEPSIAVILQDRATRVVMGGLDLAKFC